MVYIIYIDIISQNLLVTLFNDTSYKDYIFTFIIVFPALRHNYSLN